MGNGSVNGKGLLAGGALIAVAILGWFFDRPPSVIEAKVPTTAGAAPNEISSPTPAMQPSQPVTETVEPVNSEGSLDIVDTVNSDTLEQEASADDTSNPQDQDVAAIEPELDTVQDIDDTSAAAVTDDTMPASKRPVMETARVDSDGSAVIAGQAEPGQAVRILVDGVVVAETVADRSGNYAILFDVEPSTTARVLSVAVGDGDTQLVSDQDLIVMPNQVQVAQAQPAESSALEPALDLAVSTQDTMTSVAPDAETAEEIVSDTAEGLVVAAEAETSENESLSQSPSSEAAVSEASSTVTAQKAEIASSEDSTAVPTDEATTETSNSSEAVLSQAAEPVEQDVAPTVLMASKDGVKVVQSGTEATKDVTLDVISYSDQGDVTLTGRATAQSRVQVYVDNTLSSATNADAQGDWKTDLNNVDPGVYTLRIDEVDTASKVTSRIEMPFKREDRDKLTDQAALDDATPIKNITVQPGSTLWAIARDRYGEGILYVNVFNANRDKIRDPDLIYPGQIFDLPDTITE